MYTTSASVRFLNATTYATGQQLQDALDLLGARGYLHDLATHFSAAATLRPEALRLEAVSSGVLCHAA